MTQIVHVVTRHSKIVVTSRPAAGQFYEPTHRILGKPLKTIVYTN